MHQLNKTTQFTKPYGNTVKPQYMTNLSKEIENVMKSVKGVRKQNEALLKIGLRPIDITMIRFAEKQNKQARQMGLQPVFKLGNLTFGVEIECYNAPRHTLADKVLQKGVNITSECYNHDDHQDRFKLVSDGSLCGEDSVECVSPILKGNKGLEAMQKVCEALNETGAKVNRSCGLHVHFGAEFMTDEQYCRLFKNYRNIEKIIDSMMPQSRRGNNAFYAQSLNSLPTLNRATTKIDMARVRTRYYKINPLSYLRHKTVEFRQHSGTVEFAKIKNWVLFLAALIQYSLTHEQAPVASIEELTWLPEDVKNFYKERIAALA